MIPIIKGRAKTLGRIARWNERVILGRIVREVIKFLLDMGGI